MLLGLSVLVVDIVATVLARGDLLPAGRETLTLQRVIPMGRVCVVIDEVFLAIVGESYVPAARKTIFQKMAAEE